MSKELVLLALGGNAISKSGKDSFAKQLIHAKSIARAVAEASLKHDIVITHGNGPQVGNHLVRNDLSKSEMAPLPLDACGADTQGEMGYMLQQAISNEMRRRGLDDRVATVVTQVLVDAADPAFQNPTKPVGPFLSKEEAGAIRRKGYAFAEDPKGRGYRRVVPSPKPIHIIELESIKALVGMGVTTIACGGGGIPVVKSGGFYIGIEGVIDKDLSSGLLARELGISKFIILTDVDRVCIDFKKQSERELESMGVHEARRYLEQGQFPAGSMGPKVQAAIEFVDTPGKEAFIGSADRLLEILGGKSGTRISRG